MNTLRITDLARSCVWALAREDAVCASLLARSALETAAAFVDAARTASATIIGKPKDGKPGCILDPDVDLRTTFVGSQELELYSLKTIFASRLPESETIYNPTNIVTIITRISKIPQQEFVLSTYEILCEAAHPNMLGRMLYLHKSEPGPRKGNELRILGPGNGPTWQLLAEAIVAALSWACATLTSAFALMAETIETVMARPRSSPEPHSRSGTHDLKVWSKPIPERRLSTRNRRCRSLGFVPAPISRPNFEIYQMHPAS